MRRPDRPIWQGTGGMEYGRLLREVRHSARE